MADLTAEGYAGLSDREQCGQFEIYREKTFPYKWSVWRSTTRPGWVLAHNIAEFWKRSDAGTLAWQLDAAAKSEKQTNEQRDLLVNLGLSELLNPPTEEELSKEAEYGWGYGLAWFAEDARKRGLALSVVLREHAQKLRADADGYDAEARSFEEKGE